MILFKLLPSNLSLMKKFTLRLNICVFFSASLLLCLFCGFDLPDEDTAFVKQMLTKYYDSDTFGREIKRFEINVTNTGFCRYRRIFSNGKEEYFSFNLTRFKTVDFYGNTGKGELYLRTNNDDVIVQTRNDRKGDVDSTRTYMMIPMKNMETEQLNQLNESLKKMSVALISANK